MWQMQQSLISRIALINSLYVMADLIYENEVYEIVGAAMEVHRILGP